MLGKYSETVVGAMFERALRDMDEVKKLWTIDAYSPFHVFRMPLACTRI